ncbi:unnamed protein product [Durusdinium trenchii]|uniref:Uncharacterized protein n=2 Tax=Durusdinium trenchii TaxID=1381693 RepID=A0ABP0JM96_9DINO
MASNGIDPSSVASNMDPENIANGISSVDPNSIQSTASDLWRDFVKASQYFTDQVITTYEDTVPDDVPEPDPKGLFPVGVSTMIMKEENLCHTAHCRIQVANSKGGDYAFAVDRNGYHWKCVNRLQINGEPGHHDNWACIPLSCFNTGGTIQSGFKFEEDCKLPFVVVNDDGAVVEDAPTDAEEYPPIELLKPPLRPDEMSIPPALATVVDLARSAHVQLPPRVRRRRSYLRPSRFL